MIKGCNGILVDLQRWLLRITRRRHCVDNAAEYGRIGGGVSTTRSVMIRIDVVNEAVDVLLVVVKCSSQRRAFEQAIKGCIPVSPKVPGPG